MTTSWTYTDICPLETKKADRYPNAADVRNEPWTDFRVVYIDNRSPGDAGGSLQATEIEGTNVLLLTKRELSGLPRSLKDKIDFPDLAVEVKSYMERIVENVARERKWRAKRVEAERNKEKA